MLEGEVTTATLEVMPGVLPAVSGRVAADPSRDRLESIGADCVDSVASALAYPYIRMFCVISSSASHMVHHQQIWTTLMISCCIFELCLGVGDSNITRVVDAKRWTVIQLTEHKKQFFASQCWINPI